MSFPGTRALSPTKPNPGQWYHVTGVRDVVKGELELYVDGELVPPRAPAPRTPARPGNTDAEVHSLYESGR